MTEQQYDNMVNEGGEGYNPIREVRELADAFDIDHVSIWDYLPEYI